MTNDTPTCAVCGLPAHQHTVELFQGVAHTIVRDADGTSLHRCSAVDRDKNYTLGELSRMLTIIRSLRYLGGRFRNAGHYRRGDALYDYSDFLEGERNKLMRRAAKWYRF